MAMKMCSALENELLERSRQTLTHKIHKDEELIKKAFDRISLLETYFKRVKAITEADISPATAIHMIQETLTKVGH